MNSWYLIVIPAKAGIQVLWGFLDLGLRRGDGKSHFPDSLLDTMKSLNQGVDDASLYLERN